MNVQVLFCESCGGAEPRERSGAERVGCRRCGSSILSPMVFPPDALTDVELTRQRMELERKKRLRSL